MGHVTVNSFSQIIITLLLPSFLNASSDEHEDMRVSTTVKIFLT